MTEKDAPKTEPEIEEPEPHKSRKHGYRGYPNNPDIGGDIHVGTGFAGVGPAGSTASSGSGLIGEKTRESVEELGEDTEDQIGGPPTR